MTSLAIALAAIAANIAVVAVGGPVLWIVAYFAALITLLAILIRKDRKPCAR